MEEVSSALSEEMWIGATLFMDGERVEKFYYFFLLNPIIEMKGKNRLYAICSVNTPVVL